MQYNARSLRKASGGMRRPQHKKKKREMGGMPTLTTIGAPVRTKTRTMGGNEKVKLFKTDIAYVHDTKGKKVKKAKIIDVVENPAHHQYAKMKVITKGAVIMTDAGKARVTSKPGQTGSVEAVLIEGK